MCPTKTERLAWRPAGDDVDHSRPVPEVDRLDVPRDKGPFQVRASLARSVGLKERGRVQQERFTCMRIGLICDEVPKPGNLHCQSKTSTTTKQLNAGSSFVSQRGWLIRERLSHNAQNRRGGRHWAAAPHQQQPHPQKRRAQPTRAPLNGNDACAKTNRAFPIGV